jgi:hypothetical protein
LRSVLSDVFLDNCFRSRLHLVHFIPYGDFHPGSQSYVELRIYLGHLQKLIVLIFVVRGLEILSLVALLLKISSFFRF